MTGSSPPLSCQQVDNTLHVPALSCRGGFDFSLLFEELILGILPLGIVLIIAPFRLYHLFRRQAKVVASWFLWAKIVRFSNLLLYLGCNPFVNFPTFAYHCLFGC
jgi:hypothetical protein